MLLWSKQSWQRGCLAAVVLLVVGGFLYWRWPVAPFDGWQAEARVWGWAALIGGAMSLFYVFAVWGAARVPELREEMRLGAARMFAALTPADVVAAAGLAMLEEVVFRGVLQPMWGVGWASLLFALFYAAPRLAGWAVIAFVNGMILGLAYQWTSNLWLPMLAHALHQAAVLLFWRYQGTRWGASRLGA